MSVCQKQGFGSKREAKEHARYLEKAPARNSQDRGGARKTRPYLCPTCGLWHLTSQTRREQRRRQKKLGQR